MRSRERMEETGMFTHEQEGKNAKVVSRQTPSYVCVRLCACESASGKAMVNKAQFMNTES